MSDITSPGLRPAPFIKRGIARTQSRQNKKNKYIEAYDYRSKFNSRESPVSGGRKPARAGSDGRSAFGGCKMKNRIIPYNPKLKELARKLRKESTLSEVLLWQEIKRKALGVEFHRQVPIDEYIVDFYCHELILAIEIDGDSHDFEETFTHDVKRQERLESLGVRFIQFSDLEVKKEMAYVLRALQEKIEMIKT